MNLAEIYMNKEREDFIIGPGDPILITGATGFIGCRVVENLLDRGFHRVICFIKPTSEVARLEAIAGRCGQGASIRVVKGNLLSPEDCLTATRDVKVIVHLAAGGSEKSFPDTFLSTVVT